MITREILDYASRHPVFRVKDVARVLGVPEVNVSKILHYLAKRGLVRRVMKGVYSVTDDEKVVATWTYRPSYISMYSALFLHGVLHQVPARLHIVTTKILGVKELIFDGASIVYYKITPRLFYGYKWVIEDKYPYFIAFPEKAILDIIYYNMSLNVGTLDLHEIDKKTLSGMAKYYPRRVKNALKKIMRTLKQL